MAEILAVKTSLPRRQGPGKGTFETFRAEALFASILQPSGSPSAEQVRLVVATTLRRLGINGHSRSRAGARPLASPKT
jgi:hypothetical protein